MTVAFPRKVLSSVLMIGALGIVSCEQMLRDQAAQTSVNEAEAGDTTATQEQAVAPVVAKEPPFLITYPEGSKYEDLTPPANVSPDPFAEVDRIIEEHTGNPNWADKHADLKGLLLQNQDKDYYFVLQQLAANEMLRNELFHHYYQDPGNPEMLNAIGFYTDHLVEAKSEDSELIYKSLRALKDHWPKDKIARVASKTAERVMARPVASAADTTSSRHGKYRQIYARELKKMANKLTGQG